MNQFFTLLCANICCAIVGYGIGYRVAMKFATNELNKLRRDLDALFSDFDAKEANDGNSL